MGSWAPFLLWGQLRTLRGCGEIGQEVWRRAVSAQFLLQFVGRDVLCTDRNDPFGDGQLLVIVCFASGATQPLRTLPLLPVVPNLDFPVASFEVLPTPPYPLLLKWGPRTSTIGTFGSFLETPGAGRTPDLLSHSCTLGLQAIRVHVTVGQPWIPHHAALTHHPAPRCCSAALV